MRDTYGVQHGTLSSEPNETVIVNVRSFVAGAHYYFREFYDPACINASPQEAGVFIYRCTIRNDGRMRRCFRASLFSLAEKNHN
eukprot:scaffold2549_cov177-Ochromonas_danica.AAC.15